MNRRLFFLKTIFVACLVSPISVLFRSCRKTKTIKDLTLNQLMAHNDETIKSIAVQIHKKLNQSVSR